MRSLSPDEAELWAKVAATIRPLSRRRSAPAEPPTIRGCGQTGNVRDGPVPPRGHRKHLPIQDRTLDGSWDKKLRGGSVRPDQVLDLHGMNQDRAWEAIDRTLEQAILGGHRLILLITGHAREARGPDGRGRIRAAVNDWLAASRHAGHIAAVRPAHPRHGGGGSLYVILRRLPIGR